MADSVEASSLGRFYKGIPQFPNAVPKPEILANHARKPLIFLAHGSGLRIYRIHFYHARLRGFGLWIMGKVGFMPQGLARAV